MPSSKVPRITKTFLGVWSIQIPYIPTQKEDEAGVGRPKTSPSPLWYSYITYTLFEVTLNGRMGRDLVSMIPLWVTGSSHTRSKTGLTKGKTHRLLSVPDV